MRILVQISAGELIDKISILEIKLKHIKDPEKLRNVANEHCSLRQVRDSLVPESDRLHELTGDLMLVNEQLWTIEDDLRELERAKDFGDRFVALARSVYRTNDLRARIKREINDLVGSEIIEEKNYAAY